MSEESKLNLSRKKLGLIIYSSVVFVSKSRFFHYVYFGSLLNNFRTCRQIDFFRVIMEKGEGGLLVSWFTLLPHHKAVEDMIYILFLSLFGLTTLLIRRCRWSFRFPCDAHWSTFTSSTTLSLCVHQTSPIIPLVFDKPPLHL